MAAQTDVVIVDTGCANLASVGFAFDRLGASYQISRDADVIYSAPRVLIPGVGAAPYAMNILREAQLVPVLQNLTQPVMGICLGMQLIFDLSVEGGRDVACLGMVDGAIEALNTADLPSPHMGWNQLGDLADDPLLVGISAGDYAYFVHSYAAPVSTYTLATSEYGQKFSAIVRQGNVYGCQFHPERSSATGARILKNFLELGE
ncbi:imidazole glycerol phosphate synthase subunit HisH [Robiginitomaculum antarcticum]|uniref:imidazole glycerol phosphate synthase subunit HisH n=1 Tax=Robiginitomaculum antarcticum TaxID=437507 RepID=UPI000366B3A9|nr:imidazole glycerol phosphate synthase subunit HisH [Robiginitomaculum antarcticum]